MCSGLKTGITVYANTCRIYGQGQGSTIAQ